MDGRPLVSVLMTSYNTGSFIGDAIRSIQAQTLTDWELLIADDCSTDNTRDVIAGFTDPRIKVYHNTKNQHYLRTRNKLLPHVQGRYITLLDSDDLYAPQKLQRQVDEFARDKELGLCGTLVGYIDKEGKPVDRKDHKPLTYDEILKWITEASAFTGSSIMVKSEILKELGGYRDFFNGIGYEDYDLTSRIVENHKSINISEPLYYYRQYPESSSRRNMLYNPFKFHGHLLVRHFIKERASEGKDSLEKNDLPAILNFVSEKNKPYVTDPSLIHREVMWAYLHRGMKGTAFGHCLRALKERPFTWANWKATILFLLISSGLRKY